MEQGWDSEVSAFFIRIVNAIAVTIIWMLTASTVGLYAGLAVPGRYATWVTVLFYALLVISFTALVRYLRKARKKHHH
jgi:membrane protein implicated in regulation of membrane protease activity